MDLLNYEQKKRWRKINTDGFYLLNIKTNENKILIDISGSTLNVYTVTFYMERGNFFCSCPDSKTHTKYKGVVCKHICFVLGRILKLTLPFLVDNFFDILYFEKNNETSKNIITKLQLIEKNIFTEVSDDVINKEFIDAYQKNKNVELNKEKKSRYQSIKKITDDTECIICFDQMKMNDTLVECPTCHNLIHKICMENWFKNSRKTCVYCRTEWKDYGKEKLYDDSEYFNLTQLFKK